MSSSLLQFRDLVSHVFRLTMSIKNKNSKSDPSEHFDNFLNCALGIIEDKDQALNTHKVLQQHADTVYSDMMLGREMFEPVPISPKSTSRHFVPFVDMGAVPTEKCGPTLVIHSDPKPAPAEVIVTKADADTDDQEQEQKNVKIITQQSQPSNDDVIEVEIEQEEAEVEEAVEEEEVVEEESEEAEAEDEGEVVEEAEEAEEEAEEEGEVVEEAEEAEEEGEVVEEVEETEAEEEGEVVEEVEETEEEEGEVVEEVEEAEEEGEAEEEEGENVELVQIGRKKVFVGATSKLVYEAIDDETPGDDPIGRLVNGKIMKL